MGGRTGWQGKGVLRIPLSWEGEQVRVGEGGRGVLRIPLSTYFALLDLDN